MTDAPAEALESERLSAAQLLDLVERRAKSLGMTLREARSKHHKSSLPHSVEGLDLSMLISLLVRAETRIR